MPASILLLHGTDEYAVREHLHKLQAGLDPSTADMNLSRLDGRSLSFEALNTAVKAIPFLSPLRLVILTHPSAVERSRLTELLEGVPPTTVLALVEAETLRADHWLVKWMAKAGPRAELHLCAMPRLREMPGWIIHETKKQKGQIAPAAAARLAEMIGEDTRVAAQEITKLLTYVDFQRPISEADVEAVSIVSAQGSVFTLVDALGTGDGPKAQHVLHQLLQDEDPFSLWGMVIRQFRLLLQAREVLDERGGASQIQKELGLHEFVAGKIATQAGRFSLPALEEVYHRLLEIDEGVKTSQVTLDLALDMLVVDWTKK
ncbi:MAG: DNA polymerase III subunit delta [Anaerolineales bacterium]|nr:DNA polymerase III subunit delta [Anaerolineales bacterium]